MSASTNSSLGLAIVFFSGMLTASFAAPMQLSRRWQWENTWFVYATLALLVIPLALAACTVPHLKTLFASLPLRVMSPALLFGFGWGIAQVTFGLSIARVGMAMAFAIVIGLSSLLGSVIPLAVFHPNDLLGRAGLALLASAILLVAGLLRYAQAGRQREAQQHGATATSRAAFRTGILLCIFTGCFGSMINMGFVFGAPIEQRSAQLGASVEAATLSVWLVVLAAGYIPNLAYTLYLLRRNRTAALFRVSPGRETLLSLAAAVLWLFGMLGYGIGARVLGKYGDSLGFAVCMAALLLWSSALGLMSGEWKMALFSTRRRMKVALVCIVLSVTVLGFSTLLRK